MCEGACDCTPLPRHMVQPRPSAPVLRAAPRQPAAVGAGAPFWRRATACAGSSRRPARHRPWPATAPPPSLTRRRVSLLLRRTPTRQGQTAPQPQQAPKAGAKPPPAPPHPSARAHAESHPRRWSLASTSGRYAHGAWPIWRRALSDRRAPTSSRRPAGTGRGHPQLHADSLASL